MTSRSGEVRTRDFSIHVNGLAISTKKGAALLSETTLIIAQGEHVVLHGHSGAGKTLLATAMCGLRTAGLRYRGGISYVLTDRATSQECKISECHDVLERHIGFVPQQPLLDPDMTVQACITMPARLKNAPVDAEILDIVCTRLGLNELRREKAGPLSQGQKQRVAIARAFAHRPDVVILDEPTAALNQQLKEQTNIVLDELVQTLGITIISVTHEASLARRRIEMADGRVVSDSHNDAPENTPTVADRQPKWELSPES